MTPVREWYDDRGNVTQLLRWLEDRCEMRSVDDAIYLVEKPWKWTPEYNQMLAEQRALEIEGQPA